MKRIVLLFFLLSLFFACSATDYYSQGSVTPNTLTNWDINPGGGGGAPGSFINPGDKFIIQAGHTMITTAIWTVGAAGSTLQIQDGGTLQGNHVIRLSDFFQIDDGGTYIHNNNGTVAESPAATSIFSGVESFAVTSNFEIRNWQSRTTPVPAPQWGNLIINLTTDLGGNWNMDTPFRPYIFARGNLDIRSTYGGPTARKLILTNANLSLLTIGGDLLISGTSYFAMAERNIMSSFPGQVLQVNGNVVMSGSSTLFVGNLFEYTTTTPHELRFKGNFTATSSNTITKLVSLTSISYLAANGGTQTINCGASIDCNFRVSTGSTVNLASALSTGTNKFLVISGTLNQNGNNMNLNGNLEVDGGIFNSNSSVTLGGVCNVCTGDGIFSSNTTWCKTTGTKGTANFTSSTVTLNTNIATVYLVAGSMSSASPGDIYFVNSTSTTTGAGIASYVLHPGSLLSLDENSYIGGINSSYLGQGGTLRIGSPNGITADGNMIAGNIRSFSKNYDGSPLSTYEYFGTSPQVTGNGLPSTISGKLKINTQAGLGTTGVTLTQPTLVNGEFILTDGKLTTGMSNMLYIGSSAITTAAYADNSFVNGIMSKYGNSGYRFPIGAGVDIHPAAVTTTGGNPGDLCSAIYFKTNPSSICIPGTPFGGINHVSQLEYWQIQYFTGGAIVPTSKVALYASTYSDATDRSRLVVAVSTGTFWSNLGNANPGIAGAVGDVTSSSSIGGSWGFNLTLASLDPSPVNPLPIHLISFDATKLTDTKSSVNWELGAYCSAAAKFEVQRADADKKFTTIGTVGGSETNKLYNYIDNGLKNGINYYRLKMIDEDGKITYSRIVAVMNGVNGLLLTSLIPTIVTNNISLTVASSNQQKLDIIIVDMQGRIVMKRNYTVAAGNTNIELSLSGLSAGAYQLTGISLEGKTNTIRFIKQ